MSKPMTDKELAATLRTSDPILQKKRMDQIGVTPILEETTGKFIMYEKAIITCMSRPKTHSQLAMNMDAFDG